MIEDNITRTATQQGQYRIDGIEIDDVEDAPGSSMGSTQLFVKRTMDVLISVVALIVSIPIFAVLLIVIPLTSPGRAIFRQKRVGKDGKIFTMYKFRTMVSPITNGVRPKDPTDHRVTRLGRILRRTSIDEIPQFINVLKGDMSIVGPRPEMQFIVERYTPEQRKRLSVTPGITGPWQLSQYRNEPIHEHIEYDLYYIRNQSLRLDIKVMLRTLLWAYRGM